MTLTNLSPQQWHAIPADEAARMLDSKLALGLTAAEAQQRHDRFGANQLVGKPGKSAWVRFLLQFNQPLLYILLAAGVVTAFLQEWIDSGVIFGVTIINAIIGFIQESRAESAIAALAKSVTTETTLIRDGRTQRVPADRLVPGDLVELAAGDKIPADLRLVAVSNLTVDESGLTGESVPIQKDTQPLETGVALAERTCMAYMGSLVSSGQGQGLVVAIANATETGRISQLMEQSTDVETPITRKLGKFSKKLLYIVLGLAVLNFLVALRQNESWVEVFTTTVAFAVAAIPEGLPAIVTITLAIGVSRLAKRNAIVRKLAAVETLGSTTVICSDKTGTLTENQMTVQAIFAGDRLYRVTGVGYNPDGEILAADLATTPALYECLTAGLLCNDSHLQPQSDGQYTIVGDPTEAALIVVAHKAGLNREDSAAQMPRLDVIPFESQFQYMATLHQTDPNEKSIYVKGSTEAILQRCDRMLDEHKESIEIDRVQIERQADEMAQQGLRVLAFATKSVTSLPQPLSHRDLDRGLVFLGLQGMLDPPRTAAIAAVRDCQAAGIKVKMITGDHVLTATAIARMMQLSSGQEIESYSGRDLSQMSDSEFANAAASGNVFARVAPEQKLRLVEALQAKGEIVAMTGDGVNDAPALKQADLGIAMGITGTEVAKEAAAMILTDDNFASIAAAVEEGRTVYQNLLRAIAFALPVNGGEGLTILAGVLMGTALPILPLQILWINMVSATALTIPLAFEPKSIAVMKLPPRNPNEPLLTARLLRRIVIISLFNVIAVFGSFEWAQQTIGNIALSRTMAVNTLISAEAFYLLSITQFVPSIFAKLRDRRRPIAYIPAIGIAAILVLQWLFVEWSVMNQLFQTVPLSFDRAAISVAVSLPVVIVVKLLDRFDPIE
ncbi:cation-translocating P-type ATPase [Chamaesiphon minutus]|uniref:P-type ATPase, translocating n=1 Tax=Chamaesiphon minutus (strain ATCC 27169 / PCC 6605) TaxID=1173020 RepID=K9UF74_CHAP6|nr:HAD-IC family P-type ATPase [Chamaesiphon minutus]AFY93757.1 P-type ATPase, translocating [Chamaesiphon minutus PCC 6605]